jgi:hypothetical protein
VRENADVNLLSALPLALGLTAFAAPPIAPSYPPAAAKARMQGIAVVSFVVSPGGAATITHVTATNPLFAAAAQRAVMAAEFEGSAQAEARELSFEFQLLPHAQGQGLELVTQIGPSCFLVAASAPPIETTVIRCYFPPAFVSAGENSYTFSSLALQQLPLR